MYNQLNKFLGKHNIIHSHQFGFRKGHSTEHAILQITDQLKSSIDNKQITCGLFIDFSKAFDTVDHTILLNKLKKYGITGTSLLWFRNYLLNRSQYVKIGSCESKRQTMICGVPQGSTLGPLLFLLYINDIPNCSTKLSFRLFADDTNIFLSCNNYDLLKQTINEELQKVIHYCNINKLSINFSKSNYMIISSSHKNVKDLDISNISRKSYVKYLGIYIDEHLTWYRQISHVNQKISKNIGILYKLRHYVNLKTLFSLYYALIYPYLIYGIMSWDNTYKGSLQKIVRKQNQCIRCIFFLSKNENLEPYFKISDILRLESVFQYKIAIFTKTLLTPNTMYPSAFNDIITPISEIHNYNTRLSSKQNIFRPSIRTNYGKFTFKYTSSLIWQFVPDDLKSLPLKSFKSKLKKFLINCQN